MNVKKISLKMERFCKYFIEYLRDLFFYKDHPMENAIESIKGFCLICGKKNYFDSNVPLDYPCKRDSFYCRHCQSKARNRHIAKIILEKFPTKPRSSFLKKFAKNNDIKILNTCASGSLHAHLKESKNYLVAEYFDNIKSGEFYKEIQCQNLENTTFNDNTFDLIITEDVFEHISDPEKAAIEINRILKPDGYHIATISVLWDLPESVIRAKISENGKIEYILPPAYHGDPNRSQGTLVFVDFGKDIVKRFLSHTGKTEVLWSNGNVFDQKEYAIYNNMVFVSRKN